MLAPEQEAGPSSSAVPLICETSPYENSCRFGQTAIYSDTVRSGEVNLEISVGVPVEFTPTENAQFMYDLLPQPVNIYFPVTVKNTSPELAVGWIFGRATKR